MHDLNDLSKPSFRLKLIGTNCIQIHSKEHGAFEGPARPILQTAVKWGVQYPELSRAINAFKNKGYNEADFNHNGMLMSVCVKRNKKR